MGETGDVTGVEDAMVPPTPAREAVVMILRGALRVMEQAVGAMVAVGATRAGLWGEPIPMTNGTLELDPPLNLRSGGDEAWSWMFAVVEPVVSARDRSIAVGAGEAGFTTTSWSSVGLCWCTARRLDALELLRDRFRV